MVAVGCFASLRRDLLAELLVAFSEARPDVGIGMHEMGYGELLPAVATRELAVAIRPGGAEPGFAGRDLWAERVVAALAPDHPYANAGEISAEMLRGEVLLMARDPLHRYLVDLLFQDRAPATRIVADARQRHLMARVADGEGFALLCESQVDESMAQLAILPLTDAVACFPVRAHWRDEGMDPAAADLVRLIQ